MVNIAILMGNLGDDPERITTSSGKTLAKLRVATQNRNGDPDWHRIVCWDKQAESVLKYLKRGDGVHIEGRISYNKWEKEDGTTQYMTEIIASRVTFLPRKSGSGSNQAADVQPEPNKDMPF